MIQFEYIIHIFKMGWNHQFVKWWFRRLVRWIHIGVHISINLKCFFLFSSGSWNFPPWKLKTNRKPFHLISRSPKIKNANRLCVSQQLSDRKQVFAVSRCCFVLSIFWNRGKPSNSDFGMLLWWEKYIKSEAKTYRLSWGPNGPNGDVSS